MKKLTLSDPTLVLGIQDEIRRTEEARYDHRLHAVLLVGQGMSCPQVAKQFGDARGSVRNWVTRFETDGFAGLIDGEKMGRPPRLNEKQLGELERYLRKSPETFGLEQNFWDGKILSAFIKKRYRVSMGVRQCQRLFHKFGFRFRKPRPLVAFPDPVARAALKKLRKMKKDEMSDIWMLDEVLFEQHGSRCRMWIAPEEKDPTIFHAPTRKKVGYFGAVRVRDGKFCFKREEEKFNGQTFFSFLKKLHQISGKSGRHVYVVLDNARYHHAKLHKPWREIWAENFTLVFLPAYSPDMNTIERVWKYTRRLRVHNRYFKNLDELKTVIEKQFCSWKKPNESLRKLCAII